MINPEQFIYFEGESIQSIYFLKKGNAGFVLPRHQHIMYIKLVKGIHFGVLDIVGSFLEDDSFDIDTWISHKGRLRRQFTIQAKGSQCELLTLSIHDLNMMRFEFYEAYQNLFDNTYNRLRRTIRIKLKAVRYCQKYMYLDDSPFDTTVKTVNCEVIANELMQDKDKGAFQE